jgi:hypothetical protein
MAGNILEYGDRIEQARADSSPSTFAIFAARALAAHRLSMKLLGRENTDRQENRHDNKLSDEEWRLLLSGSERVRRRDLHKNLRHKHEHIQVERQHGSDNVDPPTRAGHVKRVAGDDGYREGDQRNDADHVRGRKAHEWEEESGYAG